MHFLNKKATLIKPEKIELVEEVIENLPTDSVIVKVAYCGICGSDMPRFFEGRVHFYPIVLGHEFSGTVVAVGDDVDTLNIGDKVSGVPLVPCFKCDNCIAGNFQLCRKYSFIGSRSEGALQRYLVIKPENLYKLNEEVDLKKAAFIEPITVAVHALKTIEARLNKMSRIAIYGFGVIGYCVLAYLHMQGYKNLHIINRSKKNLDLAEKLGAKVNPIANLKEQRYKFDAVIDCSPSSDMESLLSIVNSKGSLLIVGSKVRDVAISAQTFNLIQRKEMIVTGSWMSYSEPWPGDEWTIANQILNNNTYKFVDLVSGTFGIEEVEAAFAAVRKNGPKILIKLND